MILGVLVSGPPCVPAPGGVGMEMPDVCTPMFRPEAVIGLTIAAALTAILLVRITRRAAAARSTPPTVG